MQDNKKVSQVSKNKARLSALSAKSSQNFRQYNK